MALMELVFILLLQFEAGTSVEFIYLYHKLGQQAVLPCPIVSSSDTSCSVVNWLYIRDRFSPLLKVWNGKDLIKSGQDVRLSLGTRCSLIINNITAEDAGLYNCRQGRNNEQDVVVHLNVLTISSSPAADIKQDGEVMLSCSLLRYSDLPPCKQNSIRWVDETGTVLEGQGVGYKFEGQVGCVSALTVKHQSPNRRYTCQYVESNSVKIEADYTPVFTDHYYTYIIIGAVVGVLVLMLVVIAAVFKYKKKTKISDDVLKPIQPSAELDGNVTYITVSHAHSSEKKVNEAEMVTYSTIKTPERRERESDPYSYVSK